MTWCPNRMGFRERNGPRSKDVGAKRLYVFSGTSAKSAGTLPLLDVEYYDFDKSIWIAAEKMPKRRKYFGAAALLGKIWIVGGCDINNCALSTSDIYDPVRNRWNEGELPPVMDEPRRGLGLAECGGVLYAVGGNNGRTAENLSSVEEYNYKLASRGWKSIVPMRERRANMGVAALGKRLLVVGGNITVDQRSTMEIFEVRFNVWEYIGPNNFPKKEICSAAVVDDNLYITGGNGNRIVRYSGVHLSSGQTTGFSPVSGAELVSSGSTVFRIGGKTGRQVWGSVFWNQFERGWVELPVPMWIARYRPRAVFI